MSAESYLDELNSSHINCEFVREMRAQMVDRAVEMGIHLNRASVLARDYYTEANPAGADQVYAEKLRLLRGSFDDLAQLDYARLGHMRNNLEVIGVDINQQLNTNETTLAVSGATLTASFALLDIAGAPALSSLAIAGTKLAGRAAWGGAKRAAHALSRGATSAAAIARAAGSKAKGAIAKKYGTAQGGYQKLASSASNRPFGNPGCFIGDTLVATEDGTKAIDSLSVGDRVLTTDAKSQSSDTAVDAETWKHISLQMKGDDPRAGPPSIEIEVLRPTSWLEAKRCHPGSTIPFAIPEMGISGDAKVLSIAPCPPIEAGTGRVVMMTFTRTNRDLLELTLDTGETLTLTENHRLHSADRQSWAPASELQIGEHLSTREDNLSISKITHRPGAHQVFNLEVEQDHRYFTSNSQILSHNGCGDVGVSGQGGGGTLGANSTSRRTPDLPTGRGFDAGDPPVRIDGEWTVNDMKQGLLGHPPRGLGSPDIHHGGQMPGGARHEIIPKQHRNNSALHPNRSNQGVTPEIRQSDRQLHWWYRAREQGADQVLPDWIYD